MFLADSHVLIWYLTASSSLGRAAVNLLDGAGKVYFSPASIFELKSKELKNRLTLPEDFGAALIANGFSELPIKAEDAIHLGDFQSMVRHDPTDLMLLCQARRHNLRLITADQVILDLGFDWIVDARA